MKKNWYSDNYLEMLNYCRSGKRNGVKETFPSKEWGKNIFLHNSNRNKIRKKRKFGNFQHFHIEQEKCSDKEMAHLKIYKLFFFIANKVNIKMWVRYFVCSSSFLLKYKSWIWYFLYVKMRTFYEIRAHWWEWSTTWHITLKNYIVIVIDSQ